MAYSFTLRAIVRDFYLRNSFSIRQIAGMFKISKSSVSRWNNDSTLALKKVKRKPYFSNIILYIKESLIQNPHHTLFSLQTIILAKFNILPSLTTISKYIRLNKFSYKKISKKMYTNMNVLQTKRKQFRTKFKKIASSNIICIDETCFYSNEIPNYGYAHKSERLIQYSKANPIKYSVIMAITNKRILDYQIYKKTNINTDIFDSFLRTKILPFAQNKYILMDNVRFHKATCIMDSLKNNNTTPLFIPPYSPEFNPIEKAFSIIKTKFRKI